PPPLDLAVPAAPPLPAPPVPVPPPPPPRPAPRPAPRPDPRPVKAPPVPTAAPPPAAAPPQAAAPVASRISATAAADWRARLVAHLNRFKRYPPAAQMRRQQGVAYVHLILLPDGSVQAVRLQKPSGVELLDEEATALVHRAAPLPPPPEGGRIELIVPIQFTLR
ncbi:MAG: energy transducer TonB, partial [Rhodospirillales bacterium]|nr:energy transducer TonB [Rhodospirillales bacterium]